MFSGMRWTEASSCPLSHVYGQPGDRFVLVEAIATQGTGRRFDGLVDSSMHNLTLTFTLID